MTKRKRPYYSRAAKMEALQALDANDGNLYQTEKQIGIPGQRLSDWAAARREGRLNALPDLPQLPENAPLADQLEQIVARMVAIMPEKVEEASLQDLTRSLTTILTTMNQARAEQEQSGQLYDKFVQIMARFSNNGAEADHLPPSDGEGAG